MAHIIDLSMFPYRPGRVSSATSIVVWKPNIYLREIVSDDSG